MIGFAELIRFCKDVQGLLGQCALATAAILGTLATLNLQLADLIIRETERIPPLRFPFYYLRAVVA